MEGKECDHDLLITIAANLSNLTKSVEEFHKDVLRNYVTKSEFAPVRGVAYFLVSTMGVIVLVALIGSVIEKT